MTMTTTAPRSSTRVRRSTCEAEHRKRKKAETPEADLNRHDGAAELTFTEIDAGSGLGHGQHNEGGRRPWTSGKR